MAQTTGIEWCSATWNPWRGCTKVSPGCAHCYMFRDQIRFGRDPEVVVRSQTTFSDPLKWKEPKLVFTCSWSDWFHEDADQWRDEAWDIIRHTPQHTYQVLTKRPERIMDNLPLDWRSGYKNVWLGVSIENQRFAHRAAILAGIPAQVRFVSAEPLLGPLNLTGLQKSTRPKWHGETDINPLHWIHWVIAGGESGPEHRHMNPEWARSLRDQCRGHNVAFFLKQLGGWPDKRGGTKATLDGHRYTEMPQA